MTCQAKIQTTEAPRWARLADHTMDVTDAYQEVTDPDNIWGETCEAFFDLTEAEAWGANPYLEAMTTVVSLTGVCITDRHGPSYVERANAIRMLGLETVERIEGAA